MNKSFYTDKHEDKENIKARMLFIEKYFEIEMRAYRWVKIREEEAIRLEKLEESPLAKKSYHDRYPDSNDDSIWYCEYHVDVNPDLLLPYVNENNRIKHGGNLSVAKPKGTQPVVLVGQDESVFY